MSELASLTADVAILTALPFAVGWAGAHLLHRWRRRR
jgi:hypothetical protein